MKHLLITTIGAVLLVGCGESQQSVSTAEAKSVAKASQPEPSAAKLPDISIHDAANGGNIEAIKQYLAAGTDVNAKDEEGATPLHYAATKAVAELLITKGADVNAKGGYKNGTALHFAAAVGHNELVALLIANNTDVNAKIELGEYKGETPLDYAKGETVDLLRKHGGKTAEELKVAGN